MNGGREYNPPPPFFSKLPSPFSQIHHSTYVPSKHPAANAEAKGSKAQMAWLNTSEAKQRAAPMQYLEFKKRFPRANISRFQVQVDFDTNRKATAAVRFPESDGSLSDPLIQDGKYWSQAMKDVLGFHQDGGFPSQLSPFIQTKIKKPIPGVDFSKEIQQSIGDVLIYVTPTEFFTTKFREIYKKTQIKF